MSTRRAVRSFSLRCRPALCLPALCLPALCLLALCLWTFACGERSEPSAKDGARAPERLFTPWHSAGTPSPFPNDQQWFFRDVLAKDPLGRARLPRDPSVEDRIRTGLDQCAAMGPLRSESTLVELLPLAARSPATLGDELTSDSRDRRYAIARLLLRIADQLAAEPPSEDRTARACGIAELCAQFLRDPFDEVALLMQEAFASVPLEWTTLRLAKAFGKFDTEEPVVARARAATHLARRGCFGGWPLLRKVLAEQTALQDDAHREWNLSDRTAWWKEEALRGVETIAGTRFDFSADASPGVQTEGVRRIDRWWQEHQREVWKRAPALEDPALVEHLKTVILALGTFQLRNVDNAEFLLHTLGPPVAPFLLQCVPEGAACTQVRRHSIELLGSLMEAVDETQRRAWLEVLGSPAKEADPRIRIRAIDAIGASRLPEAIPVLEAVLTAGEADVLDVALQRLAHVPDPRARAVLLDYQRRTAPTDPAWIPATAAALAAGESALLDPFLEAVTGSNPRISMRASLYVPWFVPSDRLSGASTPEQRRVAAEEVRRSYLSLRDAAARSDR